MLTLLQVEFMSFEDIDHHEAVGFDEDGCLSPTTIPSNPLSTQSDKEQGWDDQGRPEDQCGLRALMKKVVLDLIDAIVPLERQDMRSQQNSSGQVVGFESKPHEQVEEGKYPGSSSRVSSQGRLHSQSKSRSPGSARNQALSRPSTRTHTPMVPAS